MKFKLIGGAHQQGGKTYTKGDIVESDTRLDKKILNKFELVSDQMPVEEVPDPDKNVTENFPAAANNGLTVLQRPDGKFDLYTDEEPDEAVNDKPLNKTGINKVVKELLS